MAASAQDLENFESRLIEGKQQLAQKAGQEAAFHDALKKNPKETIEKFFELPEGTLKEITVEIFEEKPQTIGIAIPPRPEESVELTEEQLEAVAGGAVFTLWLGAAAGVAAGVGLPAAEGVRRKW